jgi:hypothetical protein
VIGLGLLCGHLLGDYIFQTDWQAKYKTAQHPGPPSRTDEKDWKKAKRDYRTGHVACTLHCSLYTTAIWLCACWWITVWGLLACFLIHWPVDRYRLAYYWMTRISDQTVFATGSLAPWSIIVVDNSFHLLTLFVIALLTVGV